MTMPAPAYKLERYADDGVVADDPANRYRFPLISTAYPRWYYITAVVVGGLWEGVRPTEDELVIVDSFHEAYCQYWYGPAKTGQRAMMERAHPFDIDGGALGRFLRKRADGGWGCRLTSWTQGPEFWPAWNSEPRGLVEVLSRVASPNWEAWKAAYPKIFGAAR
jgi:hypothetical protein